MQKGSSVKNLNDRLETALVALGFALMMAALYLIFIYVPTEKEMGVIQRIFYIHVPLAWVAFLAFFIVFIGSILYLWKRDERWDILARSSAQIGVIFTTLVLVTGPIWAKPVWGTWWTWDARLTASLILWLTYIGYLLVRSYAGEESRGARMSAVLGIVGFVDVPLVYLSIKLWRTQHPRELVSTLEGSMMLTLMVSLAAFTVLYIILLRQTTAVRQLEASVRELKDSQQ
ncbi:MAG: cytochrome C assembly protein [Chloroflexi bacterium]|nr:cytochrome C assembly protein [Chloroflexota bacterium]